MSTKRYFSPAEWEVLQYVVEHHPVTARQVADHFAETHGHARTTVLTLLERLRKKGYLTRSQVAGVHQYSLSEPKPELLQGVVRDFVEKALGGSVSPFVAYLSREARLKPEELAELRRLVSEIDTETDTETEGGHE